MPHIMEMFGKTKVVVKDGKVVEVGKDSLIKRCPVWIKKQGIEEINPEEAKKDMELRIKDFGMFTPQRQLDLDVFVSFGASEVMMTGLRRGLLDTTVTVCEGAGTVITNNPKLVQGMGARMSGLIETEPIPEIMKKIEENGGIVLNPENAIIDQIKGLQRSAELGYKNIAVTVTDVETAKKIRELSKKLGVNAILIGAHLTGISREDAKVFLSLVDITTGCASKHIRDLVKPLVQVGTAVPLFAITQKGKELLIERAKEITSPILINTMKLPVLPEHKQPSPLVE
ncbi:MAG: methanogenesis marker 8 protein [Methanosarcinales archaeon]